MSNTPHWLVKCVQTLYPQRSVAPDIEISPNLSAAWQQVASLCQLSLPELAACVAHAFGLKVGNISQFQPGDANPLPQALCRELKVVQLWANDHTACLATACPQLTPEQHGRLRFAVAKAIELVVLPPDDIDTCLTRLFAASGEPAIGKARAMDLLSTELPGDDVPIVRFAHTMLRQAIESRASDVHVHPFVGGGAIRFRVDGRLKRIATVPHETLEGLSRYFKAQAGMEPSPLKPQDGRLRLVYGRREIDVRLSILPAFDGERMVCRLLDQSRNFSLQESRFSLTDQQTLRRMSRNSAGIVLLTGPTGSGKTSTLYALLTELNTVDVNIMTIEDPVEYVLPGISQVQVHTKQGLSFADTLRSILRQDPDIVLIGEIRDAETARIATQAALTGHLVLSTLHTNDALTTLPRLLDLGLDASILADALMGVVSQRLVRRLCDACRQPTVVPYAPAEAEFGRLTGEYPAYRPVGCKACDYSGYRGRLPVIESLEISPPLRQAIVAGERRLGELARLAGSSRRSMAASAKDWIVSGDTTPDEAQQAMGMNFWRELAVEHGIAPETLNPHLGQAGQSSQRLKILVLSSDSALVAALGQHPAYAVDRVDDADAALVYLKQHNDVIGLVMDGGLAPKPAPGQASVDAAQPLAGWLTGLRTQLAWTGLPGLFVTRTVDAELKTLLTHFGAPQVDRDDADPGALHAALTRLLQGPAHPIS